MKLSPELAKVYYTAAEARSVLGLDEEAFQYWGRTGRIKRVYLPGRKQAVYPKKEINYIAGKVEAAILTENASGLTYRKVTIDDLDHEIELAQLVFGARAGIPDMINRRKAYMQVNEDTTYHLYDGDHLAAYINIFPFDQIAINDFKDGTRGWFLGTDHLEQFKPGKPLQCIIIDMATTPTVPPARRSTYAQLRIEGFGKTLEIMASNGVEVSKLYAASNTASGIRILRHAGFQEIKNLGNERYIFELDIQSSPSKILLGYKEILQE